MAKTKEKVCTCCALHNSTNEGKKAVPKTKWVAKEENEFTTVTTYRITFECYPGDYQAIQNEIEAYGHIYEEEREIINNGKK